MAVAVVMAVAAAAVAVTAVEAGVPAVRRRPLHRQLDAHQERAGAAPVAASPTAAWPPLPPPQ